MSSGNRPCFGRSAGAGWSTPLGLIAVISLSLAPSPARAELPSDLATALNEINAILDDGKEVGRLCLMILRDRRDERNLMDSCRTSFRGLAEALRTQDKVVWRYLDSEDVDEEANRMLWDIHRTAVDNARAADESAKYYE